MGGPPGPRPDEANGGPGLAKRESDLGDRREISNQREIENGESCRLLLAAYEAKEAGALLQARPGCADELQMRGLSRRLLSVNEGVREALRCLGIVATDGLVLQCRGRSGSTPPPEYSLAGYRAFEHEVVEVNRLLRRGFPEERLLARFRHGLKFFVLRAGEDVAATTWIVTEGERFVDEEGVGLLVPADGLWVRDIFIAPQRRGRGLFAVLLDGVREQFPKVHSIWSDVDRDNHPSLSAHLRYGFEPVARFTTLHLAGQLMIRLRWPVSLPMGSVFKPHRRVLLTGAAYRQFVSERRT